MPTISDFAGSSCPPCETVATSSIPARAGQGEAAKFSTFTKDSYCPLGLAVYCRPTQKGLVPAVARSRRRCGVWRRNAPLAGAGSRRQPTVSRATTLRAGESVSGGKERRPPQPLAEGEGGPTGKSSFSATFARPLADPWSAVATPGVSIRCSAPPCRGRRRRGGSVASPPGST